MNIIYVLLPIALLLGLGFLITFIHLSLTGQYEDLDTPAHRLLIDDEFGDEFGDESQVPIRSSKQTKEVIA